MGKKGKGAKKEDKPKKDIPQTTAAKKKTLQEALEGTNVNVSTPAPRPASRTSASKKSDRGGNAFPKIGCTESFRWDNSEEAPALPPLEDRDRNDRLSRIHGDIFSLQLYHSLRNWPQYLQWRCNGDNALMRSALNNKTLKDGLSGPLSIASMILNWMVYNSKLVATVSLDALETEEPLHIVVVGATAVYEEKILRESDYWDELLAIFRRRKVRLYLTGPEMSGKDGEFKKKKPSAEEGQQQQEDGSRVECWKTTAVDFFLAKGRLELFQKEDTVVVGLNCGFGVATYRMLNTPVAKQDLASNQVLWNWIPSLHFIAALELPLMVTCSDDQGALLAKLVLENAVGMYNVKEIVKSPTPFESTIPGPENEVRANKHFMIVQGQQPGHHFAAEPPQPPSQPGEKDPRIDELKKLADRWPRLPSKKWPKPPSHIERLQHKGVREQASPLVPLKRYGNYPPENREKCTSSHDDHDDDRRSETDVPVRAERGKEQEGVLPSEVVKLNHSVVDEGPSSLKITVEGAFMTDPASARVGMRRNRFALHYFDCQTLRDVVFQAALPKEVDHTTTQITFKRSTALVTIIVRLLESKK